MVKERRHTGRVKMNGVLETDSEIDLKKTVAPDLALVHEYPLVFGDTFHA